jgi:chromosome partitioning protein
MTHTIAISNQKGGTSKTTTAINLGGALADLGKKILLVDADPQGSLGVGFGIDVSRLEKTIYDVMVQGVKLETILRPVRDSIDLAPANIYLSVAELQLAGEIRREDRLRNALTPVKDQYDFVLIDCPPSLGLLTINALSAADAVLIPMSCDYYSLVGVRLLLETIGRIQAQLNPQLKILGVLPTRFDRRTLHAKEVLDEAREKLAKQKIKVFDTIIRETVRLKEAPIAGKTITEYQSKHPAADDYRVLAQEVVNEFSSTSVS